MATETAQLEIRRAQYRDYPEDLKAAVIAAIENNGGNVLATSKLFNLPRDTVNYWWKHSDRFVEVKQASSANLADKYEQLAHSYVESLSEHDQSLVTARDKIYIASTATQMTQLLRGEPTAIVGQVERTDVTVILQSALSDAIDITPTD